MTAVADRPTANHPPDTTTASREARPSVTHSRRTTVAGCKPSPAQPRVMAMAMSPRALTRQHVQRQQPHPRTDSRRPRTVARDAAGGACTPRRQPAPLPRWAAGRRRPWLVAPRWVVGGGRAAGNRTARSTTEVERGDGWGVLCGTERSRRECGTWGTNLWLPVVTLSRAAAAVGWLSCSCPCPVPCPRGSVATCIQ